MNSLFDQSRAFWRLLNKFADIVILNVVFLLCCVPIVTIGPAYTALYYTLVKTIRKGRGYAMKNFLHSFKQNLLQGITAWIICLVLLSGCAFWVYIFWNDSVNGGTAQIGFWLILILGVLFAAMTIYLFPVLSRFEMNLKNLFVLSYIMTIRYIIYSLILVVLLAAFAFACYICIPLLVIILPALYVLTASFIIEKVFAVYMPKFEARNETATGEDNGEELQYLGAAARERAESQAEADKGAAEESPRKKDQWYYE